MAGDQAGGIGDVNGHRARFWPSIFCSDRLSRFVGGAACTVLALAAMGFAGLDFELLAELSQNQTTCAVFCFGPGFRTAVLLRRRLVRRGIRRALQYKFLGPGLGLDARDACHDPSSATHLAGGQNTDAAHK